jgi:hypothetical protein
MGNTLNIPSSVVESLRIPEAEIPQRLRTELAIALYALVPTCRNKRIVLCFGDGPASNDLFDL